MEPSRGTRSRKFFFPRFDLNQPVLRWPGLLVSRGLLGGMTWEVTMRKIVTAGATALFVAVSTLSLAQTPSRPAIARPSALNWETLTDARINVVKAALQMTADQEKYWPAVEDAIRARAKDRQARTAAAAERVRELRAGNFEALRDRDPVEFLHRHADTLAQRAADLKKLADAWQPLYQNSRYRSEAADGLPYDLCTS